jgi:nucleolar protein 56
LIRSWILAQESEVIYLINMSDIDYLLHESSVGYAIFQVVHQADTVGNRLKEVQDAGQDLAKFGKMVKLVNFAPYRYILQEI